MEFDDLGKHCSYCKQKDILPMECSACHKYFCLEHIRQEDHNCEKLNSDNNNIVVCKKCGALVKLIDGVDPKILIEEHLRFNCNPKNAKKPKVCPVPGCGKKLYAVNTYKCEKCGLEVCMEHRFPEDHNCTPKTNKSRFLQSFLARIRSHH